MIMIPSRPRRDADIEAEIAACVDDVTAALTAASRNALNAADIAERRLRLLEVAIAAARGHDELRNLFLRLRAASSEHADLEELTLACGLFAAAHATAILGAGCDMVAQTTTRPIDCIGSYHLGLEWIVELIGYAGAYHRSRRAGEQQ